MRLFSIVLSVTLLGRVASSFAQPIDCTELPAGITDCVRDEDCVYSPRIGLCDCANGGTEIAVNRGRLNDLLFWGTACTGVGCLFVYNCNGYEGAQCVEGTCLLGSCGDGIVAPGETCDTGGTSSSCDADCSAPVCGDWTVNAATGETCDDGNVAGGDGCSTACACDDSTDSDGDGIGDACDGCVNAVDGAVSTVLGLKSVGLDPVAGDDSVKHRVAFPLGAGVAFGELDLAGDDLRLSLRRADGAPIVELVLPGGMFDGVRGWRSNSGHDAWTYLDKRTAAPATGIRKARLMDAGKMGLGMVLLKLAGKDADYPVGAFDPPLQITVAIGSGNGRCGERVYDRADCRVSAGGDNIKCRR